MVQIHCKVTQPNTEMLPVVYDTTKYLTHIIQCMNDLSGLKSELLKRSDVVSKGGSLQLVDYCDPVLAVALCNVCK